MTLSLKKIMTKGERQSVARITHALSHRSFFVSLERTLITKMFHGWRSWLRHHSELSEVHGNKNGVSRQCYEILSKYRKWSRHRENFVRHPKLPRWNCHVLESNSQSRNHAAQGLGERRVMWTSLWLAFMCPTPKWSRSHAPNLKEIMAEQRDWGIEITNVYDVTSNGSNWWSDNFSIIIFYASLTATYPACLLSMHLESVIKIGRNSLQIKINIQHK